MASYTDQFKSLVSKYLDMEFEFPSLRAISVAQWTLESGYGTSGLATEHLNFGGLKWRNEMKGFAKPVDYAAHDGAEKYCKFSSLSDFVKGYWHFLDRDPYEGWRSHTASPSEFIRFIGPIYTPTALYADSVIGLLPKAEALIAEVGGSVPAGEPHQPDLGGGHGSGEVPPKPAIKDFIQSPNHSSRNGERIRRIVMHYTTSRNVNGTIDHFLNPASKVSAHYVIARDGTIFQMVRDSDKAWHAKGANADSIGIEHSAAPGDQMTAAQELSSISLVRWLLSEYKLPKSSIHGHKYTPENAGTTNCPHQLFGADAEAALNNWVHDKV